MDIKEAKKILSENKDITDEMIKQYVKSTERVGGRLTAKDLTSKINFNERKEEYNNKKLRIFKLAYMFTCLLFVLLLGVGVLVSYNVGINSFSGFHKYGVLTEEEMDIVGEENDFYSDYSMASISVSPEKHLFIYYGYDKNKINYYYKLTTNGKQNNLVYLVYDNTNTPLVSNELVKFATQYNVDIVNTLSFDIVLEDITRSYSFSIEIK